MVVAKGNVGTFESVFKVQINDYEVPSTHYQFRANASDPTIPAGLEDIVQSVSLNDVRSDLRVDLKDRLNAKLKGKKRGRRVHLGPTSRSQTGLVGFTSGALKPSDLVGVYQLPSILNKHANPRLSGNGVTIAILAIGDFRDSDLKTFLSRTGVKRTAQIVRIPVGAANKSIDPEATLDVEWLSAAPGATVLVYDGADTDSATEQAIFQKMVQDNKADIISISFGGCELWYTQPLLQTDANIFRQAAAQGITVFAASGDTGAYPCYNRKYPTVFYPASDPSVTAVGGTTLHNNGAKRSSEVCWTGSGGGYSAQFGLPDYQKGVSTLTQQSKRGIPDVSFLADPAVPGYYLVMNGSDQQLSGGTSAGTPVAASLWALVLEDVGGGRLGAANPYLYAAYNSADRASMFFDVTKGANSGDGKIGQGLNAVPGWDACTGLGVPQGTNLAAWIKNHQSSPQPPPTQAMTAKKP
jgi:kumamolisin